jgi:hypothetical protein
MSNELVHISDEQAKAIQEALKTLQGFGGFLRSTFGTVPEDIVGLLGGDYLKVRRAENVARMIGKAKKRLENRKVENADAPPSIAIPIIIAAADESRDALQEIWAALLVAAADPTMQGRFRIKFIDIAKRLDPLDASVLIAVQGKGVVDGQINRSIASDLGVDVDQVVVSIFNLSDLGLLTPASRLDMAANQWSINALGREFARAVA